MKLSADESGDRDFIRARELLRGEAPLSGQQLRELEDLFQQVSGTHFMALASDPAHGRALRQYRQYTRRRSVPIMAFFIAVFVVSVLAGGTIVLSR